MVRKTLYALPAVYEHESDHFMQSICPRPRRIIRWRNTASNEMVEFLRELFMYRIYQYIVSDVEKSMSVENRDDDPGCARARAMFLKFSEHCKCKFSIAYDCLKLNWSIIFSLEISNSSKSSWMCAPRKKNVRKS